MAIGTPLPLPLVTKVPNWSFLPSGCLMFVCTFLGRFYFERGAGIEKNESGLARAQIFFLLPQLAQLAQLPQISLSTQGLIPLPKLNRLIETMEAQCLTPGP